MRNLYNIEDMQSALDEAINHIDNAIDELDGMVEYQYEIDELISTKNRLEQLLEETNEILAKQQEEEQRELEREYYKTRL